MPLREVLFELLPIVVDCAAAAVFLFQVHLITRPRLRHRDVRADSGSGTLRERVAQ